MRPVTYRNRSFIYFFFFPHGFNDNFQLFSLVPLKKTECDQNNRCYNFQNLKQLMIKTIRYDTINFPSKANRFCSVFFFQNRLFGNSLIYYRRTQVFLSWNYCNNYNSFRDTQNHLVLSTSIITTFVFFFCTGGAKNF